MHTPSWGLIVMLFFCHPVVRITLTGNSTSNYKVAEESITLLPQLVVVWFQVKLSIPGFIAMAVQGTTGHVFVVTN